MNKKDNNMKVSWFRYPMEKSINITAHLETAYKTEAREVVKAFEKTNFTICHRRWMERNLRQLDDCVILFKMQLRTKRPTVDLQTWIVGLFTEMIDTINRKVLAILMRGQIPMREPEQVREARPSQRMDLSKYKTQKDEVGGRTEDPTKQDTANHNITNLSGLRKSRT